MLEKITVEDYHNNNSIYFDGKHTLTQYWVFDRTRVNYGHQKDCNVDWCAEHNIPVFEDRRGGGCLVSAKGNVVLVDVRDFDGHTWLGTKIMKDFAEYLKNKGLDVKFDHNDILVEGYKVASGVSTNLKPDYKKQYTGIQISINQDLNVIEHACRKKMLKVPKGLSDFGITTEDIENWLSDYFK